MPLPKKFNHPLINSVLLVVLLHAVLLGAVLLVPKTPGPITVAAPTIQGVIVMAQPATPPEIPPPPVQKPQPKPKPVPKAPPSERAVKAPEPEPVPVTTPVESKPAEPQPAPVLPPNAEANKLNNPAPTYPSISRRLREQGTVMLELLVKADGTIGDIKIKISSGYKRLDEAALKTVRNWHFAPATRAGVAIDYTYDLPIEFSLNQR